MGVCHYDMDEGHRQYSVRYALNDREGVAALLKDIHRLRERRFHQGDYSASDILADLQTAIDNAKLTKRQREALYYVYELDLTQKDAGERMGITDDGVKTLLNGRAYPGALERIANVFSEWDYGEIILPVEESIDDEI